MRKKSYTTTKYENDDNLIKTVFNFSITNQNLEIKRVIGFLKSTKALKNPENA